LTTDGTDLFYGPQVNWIFSQPTNDTIRYYRRV